MQETVCRPVHAQRRLSLEQEFHFWGATLGFVRATSVILAIGLAASHRSGTRQVTRHITSQRALGGEGNRLGVNLFINNWR